MRIFGFIAAVVFSSTTALAEPAPSIPQPGSLSIAAVETGAALDWQALGTPSSELKARAEGEFDEQSRKLNEQIAEQIDQRLQEKLERQLQPEL